MSAPLEWWVDLFHVVVRLSLQGSLVTLLVLAVQTLVGRHLPPAWRHALWLLVLLRMSVPDFPDSAISVLQPLRRLESSWQMSRHEQASVTPRWLPAPDVPAAPQSQRLTTVDPPPSAETQPDWNPASIVALAWLAGTGVLLLTLLAGHARFARRLRRASSAPDQELQRLVDACRYALGVRDRVRVVETPAVKTPALYGLLAPRLLLPAGIRQRFGSCELRHVILHELAHVQRRDLLLHWAAALLRTVHWFNPLMWLAERRIRQDRELACDARVLSLLSESERPAYGRTILGLVDGAVAVRPAASMVGILEDPRHLEERIRRIAGFRRYVWSKRVAAAALTLLMSAVTLTDAPPTAAAPAPEQAEPVQGTGQPVLFRVIDAATGRPLAGARIGDQAVADAGGVALVSVRGGELVLVDADGYAARAIRFAPTELPPAEYLCRLHPARHLGGRVADEVGRPVAGAEIRFLRPQYGSANTGEDRPGVFGADYRLQTDAAGRWSCNDGSPDLEDFALKITHPDHMEMVWYTQSVPQTARVREEPVRIDLADLRSGRAVMTLRRGIEITGRVFDPAGRPIAGAVVKQGLTWTQGPYAETTAGPDGAYRFGNGNLGKMTLSVFASGFTPEWKTFEVHWDNGPVDFYLEPGRVLRGRVVDEQDRPIAGARVTASASELEIPWSGRTAEDGTFAWEGAPLRRVEFHVRAEGYRSDRNWLEPTEQEHRLTLRTNRVFHLTGTVRDAVTGAPIPEFEVSAGSFSAGLARPIARGRDGILNVQIDQQTLETGLRISQDHRSRIAGYGLRVEARGYAPERSIRLPLEGLVELDIRLAPRAALAGQVFRPDGRPADGARLFAADQIVFLRGSDPPASPGRNVRELEVDREGRFTLDGAAEAGYLIVLHDSGFAWLPARDVPSPLRLGLQAWGRVQGQVLSGGWPAPGVQVRLGPLTLKSLREDAPGLVIVSSLPILDPQVVLLDVETTTDADGRFILQRVPPGRVDLTFQLPDRDGKLRQWQRLALEVRPGQTASADLGASGRPVVGRIRFEDPRTESNFSNYGRTLTHQLVAKSRPGSLFFVWIDEARSFRVEGVPPGAYTLVLQVPSLDGTSWMRDVLVPESGAGPVDLGVITIR